MALPVSPSHWSTALPVSFRMRPGAAQDFESVESRKSQVQEHDVRPGTRVGILVRRPSKEVVERRLSGGNVTNLVGLRVILETTRQELGVGELVLDVEDQDRLVSGEVVR